MTLAEAELIRNAKKPLEFNVEKGDEVCIISDTGADELVWMSLNNAARSMDVEPTVVLMPQAPYSYAEPPKPVATAMEGADLILMATSKGLGHSDAASAAIGAGKKVILMSEISRTTLSSAAASADYDEILATGNRIKEWMDDGSKLKITGPAGTDLTADITDKQGSVKAARCVVEGEHDVADEGDIPAKIAAFPDGEVPLNPVFGSTNGTIVWDTTMHEIGAIDEPIEANVEDGFVTDIRGGREADQLRSFLESFDNDNVYNIGEISVNTNPEANITGRLREDKKALGYLHIAVGSGGSVEAPVHIDGVLKAGTVSIDDEEIMRDGELVI